MIEFLGTTWWSVVCVAVGFGFGVYMFPSIKSWIMNRGGK